MDVSDSSVSNPNSTVSNLTALIRSYEAGFEITDLELGFLNDLEEETLNRLFESDDDERLVLIEHELERLVQLMRETVQDEVYPSAAIDFVLNLPSITLTVEQLQEDNICAVCMDEFSTEEEVTWLPCSHYFHENCILPWLRIRNTCPLCRYEFPTESSSFSADMV
ncbi:zinc finger protein [Macleaya cordata]|uniref:RING-type E3 ubiquitin transferase n=1 Tax=Macleaya cordata TaxID=56857 RepID=A0A200QIQ6_MACCD|nr:zinc finger protein [Macleaya cordata]